MADSDQLAQTANRIATAASILAAAAFIVALAQAILEYASSSTSRIKCTKAAIGITSENKTFGWSFSGWKLKVYFPEIDFSQKKVLEVMVDSERMGLDSTTLPDINFEPKVIGRAHLRKNGVAMQDFKGNVISKNGVVRSQSGIDLGRIVFGDAK